jgi:hypothetical protein
MQIRAFKSAMNSEMAQRKLSSNGLGGLLRRCISGKILALSEIFIPYRLYKIKTQDCGARAIRFLAVDSVSGTLDPIEFSGTGMEYECRETRNILPQKISEDETRAIVVSKLQRAVFSSSLFQFRNTSFVLELVEPDFYLPYWIGFYGDRKNIDLLVLNSITHAFEGGRMTACVKAWLHDHSAASAHDSVAGSGGCHAMAHRLASSASRSFAAGSDRL